jgi:hypothetical protein
MPCRSPLLLPHVPSTPSSTSLSFSFYSLKYEPLFFLLLPQVRASLFPSTPSSTNLTLTLTLFPSKSAARTRRRAVSSLRPSWPATSSGRGFCLLSVWGLGWVQGLAFGLQSAWPRRTGADCAAAQLQRRTIEIREISGIGSKNLLRPPRITAESPWDNRNSVAGLLARSKAG